MTNWAERYEAQETPWNVGGPHPELKARFEKRAGEQSALVPGCGHGHDALFLAQAGLRVVGLDLSPQVEDLAGEELRAAGGELHVCDALAWQPEEAFDLVFEHTFLCAINPELRSNWAALMQRCVKPGGRVLAVAFPGGKAADLGGPPFGYSVDDMLQLLGASFSKTLDEPVQNGVDRRDWEERWVEFVRAD